MASAVSAPGLVVQVVRVNGLPRYERPVEGGPAGAPVSPEAVIPFAQAADAIAGSTLSPGSRRLLLGLLRTGAARVFPGGGIGIEYGSLLKTAVRPDLIAPHVAEVAAHLNERRVDLLLVPGMSGYPVGAVYALAAGIPAVLLKKQKVPAVFDGSDYPPGSFVIPSYTGEGDVVISADLAAVRDIVATTVAPQIEAQRDRTEVELTIRAAGADDIIDKAVMAHAATESAPAFCQDALDAAIAAHRAATGDARSFSTRVDVVSWVTPMMKIYNDPHGHLQRTFGIRPFAGVRVSSVHLDPPAIGVEGLGVVAFAPGAMNA